MSTDPLAPLLDAYRAETAHRDRDAGALRRRVLVAAGRRRRAPRPSFLVPLAAILMGSVAFAATDARTARSLLAFFSRFRPDAQEGASTAGDRAPRPTRAAAPAPSPSTRLEPPESVPQEETTPAVPAVTPEQLPEDEPAATRSSRSSLASRPAPHSAPHPAPHPEPAQQGLDVGADLALYRAAHTLHFGGAAPAEALSAWRRYLAVYPSGVLAAEARLNEAVCLLKLGQHAEAERLLERLDGSGADGTRTRAAELLRALRRR